MGSCFLASRSGLLGAAAGPRDLRYQGINYDVGTNYEGGEPTEIWHSGSMRRAVGAIRHELHCNSIGIHGTDIAHLVECSTAALAEGLQVWLQPRLFDSAQDEVLDHLSETARQAERLRKQYGQVVLNVGCELSLFTQGFVPGKTALERIATFGSYAHELPAINRKLDAYLARARRVARDNFGGPLTYGSGPWEWDSIDWSGFDFIGLDHYMDESNQATYVDDLRRFRRGSKPVVVTEFGCCTFEGAEKAGGMGWDILDHSKGDAEFKGTYIRSERVQADYIGRLLDLFAAEHIDGAFVYQFVSPELPYSADPRKDLDMASYGIVKVVPDPGAEPGAFAWEPKLAFHEIARRFAPPDHSTRLTR